MYKFLNRVEWETLRADVARRRQAGEMVGLGLGFFVEKSGLGPFDDVRITLGGDGTIEVITGAASIGQGVETVMAQICADGLGTGLDRIRVIHGQTDRIARGMGAFASRVTVMTGAAVTIAAAKLRGELLRVAGRLLQTAPERLAITGDRVVVCDAPGGPSLDLGAIARGAGGELTAEATFTTEHMTYPYGVHLAQVRIERDSCAIAVERFFVGYDVGRAVNPMLVEGQIAGGAAQGIGAALLEEFVYDASGQPQSVTLADYLMPTIAEIPDYRGDPLRGCTDAAQPARCQRCRRSRHQRGGCGDRRRGRRCARPGRRGPAIADHTEPPPRAAGRASGGGTLTPSTYRSRKRSISGFCWPPSISIIVPLTKCARSEAR